jgi:hypothetical protein
LLAVCALALVTGIVLAETRLVALTPIVAHDDSMRQTANTDLVRSFFAAVNDTLRTGDPAPLETLLAPDYEERANWLGGVPMRDGLGDSLRSLHAVYPELRLTIGDLLAEDDRVVAWITTAGPPNGTFLGLPVSGATELNGVHLFRIGSGRILEYRHETSGHAMFEPLVSAPITLTGTPWKTWTLTRRTYPPGAGGREAVDAGSTLLWIERGALTLELDDRSAASALVWPAEPNDRDDDEHGLEPGKATRLGPGAAVVVPPSAVFTTRNDDPSPVAVLALTFTGIPNGYATGLPIASETPSGISGEILAGGSAVALPSGPMTLGLGRATVGSATEFPLHQVNGGELIAVEAGTMGLLVDAGVVVLTTPAEETRTTAAREMVGPGEGVAVGRDGVVGYRNAGTVSLTLFVVTLSPATVTGEGSP